MMDSSSIVVSFKCMKHACFCLQDQLVAARRAAGAGGGKDDAAQKWLNEQKLKLVAFKQAERKAEMEQYKAEKVCM